MMIERGFGTLFCSPNCLRNCWISGGRLPSAVPEFPSCTILTFTDTTAGLTRAINGANDGEYDGAVCPCVAGVETFATWVR